MISIQTEDFNLDDEYNSLRQRAGDPGAIVTFAGLVREIYDQDAGNGDGDGKVNSLYLEHYPGMTEKCLQDICEKASLKWPVLALRVIHRVGDLSAKDQIVFVGVATAHRKDAFEAAQFIMDYLKSNAPFWKKQSSDATSNWVESRQSDVDSLERWKD